MTDRERINRLAEARERLIAALALEMSAEAYALVFAAALLVADATPSIQLTMPLDAASGPLAHERSVA